MVAIAPPVERQRVLAFRRDGWVRYAIRRVGIFFLIVWAAASLNFFLPRLAPGQDPVRARMGQLAATGAATSGIEEMVASYQKRFGLDEPLYIQYVRYIGDYARFDFGYSLALYPSRVIDLIGRALPWTLSLLLISTIIAFALGTLAGALLGWQRSPTWLGHLFMPFLTLSAIPYYLLGLVLIYFLAFEVNAFPLSGGYSVGGEPGLSIAFIRDAVNHSILPAFSIVLAQIGFWALGMRGMMVMTEGEDFMTYAEAKGLAPRTVFFRYGIRNALLPQTTALALQLGGIVSQSVLVEVVFGYPGIGTLLYRAISGFDYFLIYGIVFLVIVSIGLTTLILDLVYPLLDPRITYHRQ
ncbi:MAG: ABC transporter permease [Thermomicrobiales bacterium]